MICLVLRMNNNIEELLKKHNVSPLIESILSSQDLNFEQVDQILEDKKYELQSVDLDRICERLYKAKVLEEKIVIVGDYDADGIMSTTILHKAFDDFGIEVGFYIPNRLTEGYGLNETIVQNVYDKGYRLMITVDNGVVAYNALDKAKALGMEVIVTDHHHLDEAYNYPFDYLLHPKNLSDGYHDLCGAGLALLIAERLINKNKIGELYVFAMVATLADMVSVFGFNRNIIKNGLYYINKVGQKHIEQLIHYRNGVIDQQVISFQVVPKLNTFGRLADLVNVNNSVRYFLLSDEKEIKDVATSITSLNQKRIEMTRQAFENGEALQKWGTLNVALSNSLHEGLTGLIAGRHLNQIHEPVLALTLVDGVYKGSGRSPKGYDIRSLLEPFSDHFISFGGHAQACGISFDCDNLDEIQELVSEASKSLIIVEEEDIVLNINSESLSISDVEAFESLSPYGIDFIKPKLKVSLKLEKRPTVLKEKYLKWSIRHDLELLSFNSNMDLEFYKNKTELDALVNLSLNTFRDKTTINMIVDKFID